MNKLCKLSIFAMNLIFLPLFCQNSYETVDREINSIEKEIHEASVNKENAEVNSEKYIKYEWAKYVDEIQKAEDYDNKIHLLEDRLKKLKEERTFLKKSSPAESQL